jgi:hypothetical protein
MARGGRKQRRRDQAWAKPEEGDDRWGPPVSRALSCDGGGNREGCHRLKGQLGRSGPALPKSMESFIIDLVFLNFNGFQILARLWKFVQGDLGGILIWGFLQNSSRLIKDFRKIEYVMQCMLCKITFGRFFHMLGKLICNL